MQVVIGSRRHDTLRKANDWFAHEVNREMFEQLGAWAVAQEHRWGNSVLLIEPEVPGIDEFKATNIDLVLAFSDRVAVCEVKNHRSFRAAQSALFKSLAQSCDCCDLVKAHLGVGRAVVQEAVRPFLLFPQLNTNELRELIQLQFAHSSLRHAILAGGVRCQTTPQLLHSHPVYFPVAMQSRLGQTPHSNPSLYRRDAADRLTQLVTHDDTLFFNTLSEAVAYVKAQMPIQRAVRLPPGHVPGLRPRLLRAAMNALNASRVIELVGPFGIGKTSAAREIIGALASASPRALRVAACEITTTQSLRDFALDVLEHFDAQRSRVEMEDDLIERLLECEHVVWIRSYAPESVGWLRPLLEHVIRSHATSNCCFIVESVTPLFDLPESTDATSSLRPITYVHVSGFTRQEMRAILESADSPAREKDDVLAFSGLTNPRLALARAQFNNTGKLPQELVRQFVWTERVFTEPERSILAVICSILDTAPFGMTFQPFQEVVCRAFPELPRALVRRALWKVCSRLRDGRMVQQASRFSATLEPFGICRPERILYDIDPFLSAYVLGVLPHPERDLLRRRIDVGLESARSEVAYINIILALRRNTVEPFFLSAFRNGFWGALTLSKWLSQHPDLSDVSAVEAYLRRYAHTVARLHQKARMGKRLHVAAEDLTEVPDGFELGRRLSRVLHEAVMLFEGGLETFRVDGTNTDLSAEALCWTFDLMHVAGRSNDPGAGRILADHFERLSHSADVTSIVRVLIYRRLIRTIALAGRTWFLNDAVRLTDLFTKYFALAKAEDNFWYLVDIARYVVNLRNGMRRDVKHAVWRFEDDGNPNPLPEETLRERRARD